MTNIGAAALREAWQLQVTGFAFANDLKDAGVDSPTALVAENVAKGMLNAYCAQAYLRDQHLATFRRRTKIILLADPAFFVTAGEGISRAIAAFDR